MGTSISIAGSCGQKQSLLQLLGTVAGGCIWTGLHISFSLIVRENCQEQHEACVGTASHHQHPLLTRLLLSSTVSEDLQPITSLKS